MTPDQIRRLLALPPAARLALVLQGGDGRVVRPDGHIDSVSTLHGTDAAWEWWVEHEIAFAPSNDSAWMRAATSGGGDWYIAEDLCEVRGPILPGSGHDPLRQSIAAHENPVECALMALEKQHATD